MSRNDDKRSVASWRSDGSTFTNIHHCPSRPPRHNPKDPNSRGNAEGGARGWQLQTAAKSPSETQSVQVSGHIRVR